MHPYVWPEVRRGAERYLRDLAAYLRGRGHGVEVAATANGSPPKAPGHRFGGRTAWRALVRLGVDPLVAFAPAMGMSLLGSRADLVHCLSPGDGLAAVTLPRRGRSVVTTLMGIPHRAWTERTRSSAVAYRRLLAGADEVICLSRHVADVLEAEYGRRGVVIPPGVDTRAFRPVDGRAGPPTILFVGALDEPRKGIALLAQAFRELAASDGDVRLVITGPGDASDTRAALDALAGPVRDRIALLDVPTEALPEAYARASVTVLPSRGEAFGLVLAESLACGTPVVGTDEAGIPEIVDDPAVGRTFRAGDAGDLARALTEALRLADDPRTAERCRTSAMRFDWETVVGPRIEELYRGLRPATVAGAR